MPIAAAFAPNYTLRDVLIAGRFLLPWNRKQLQTGDSIAKFEFAFREYMDVDKAVSFQSGRAGLFAILKALDIKPGDEIILQAFTTVALPNTIKLFGAKPVFVDISLDSFNMDPDLLEERISPKTKAIIIQHTFGNPADLEPIMAIAARHTIATIEDCAHSLGAKYKGKKTGTFGTAAFFSFGRDKVVSSVSGGMVIAQELSLLEKIEAVRNEMPFPEEKDIRKSLLHPIVTFKALHTYRLFKIGKVIMYLSYRFNLLDKAYTAAEKKGEPDKDAARRLPNALAAIGLHQLKLVNRFNRRRMKVAGRYAKNIVNPVVVLPQTSPIAKNIFLWYTILTDRKAEMIRAATKEDIILGDWFPQAIGPIEVDPVKAGYIPGSCPMAEKAGACAVNLPTHHNMQRKETQKVIDFINAFK
jgi:dTDP-4-amino-4,6-dideoxygalactose transaminase